MEEDTKKQEESGGKQADIKGMIAQLESMLDEYMVKKAPFALPIGLKEFIANVSPYLIIIFAVLALPAIFLALGLSAVFAPFAMMGGYAYGHGWGLGVLISLIVSVVVLVMEVMAVPGLFKRTRGAWRLLFYASIVSLVGSILSISGIVGGVIGAIIGWYVLFQMKDLYKN
ncbi:MAG: hypothetical protein PHW24_00915 [Candidatus Moranbacteria bacterium]|nr:hypothetical protein [Candidatus Moranbacteria bacterium]